MSKAGRESEKVRSVVIGAGVVGAAVASRLAADGLEPWVFESGPRIAEGVTSRNSGVIHSGIYYPPDSLKAKSCVRGRALLYEWCGRFEVPHRKTGKWIVGPASARETLEATLENARAAGAVGLEWFTKSDIENALPAVTADFAVYCPESGIVDPFEFTRSLRNDAESNGAQFVLDAEVTGIARLSSGAFRIETTCGVVESEIIVNCAGLRADEIARKAGIDRYRIYPWRGDYFRFRSATRFDTLIYPTKPKGAPGLGVHLTLSLDGAFRLGPDAYLVDDRDDFSAPPDIEEKKRRFFDAANAYLKGLSIDCLTYDSCGIRPKLRSPTDREETDFVLSEDLPGFVNLIGIESPGLTSALDLADRTLSLLTKRRETS